VPPAETGAQPQFEAAPSQPTPEVQAGSSEGANQGPGMILPAPVAPAQASTPTAQGDLSQAAQQPVVDSPDTAEEVDVIEKEWVDKAKAIVEQTKEDPYLQKRQVSALKADYLKKRYGKDVRVNDGA
jgi:hypothetical protein